jgi:molecular chaperone HscB
MNYFTLFDIPVSLKVDKASLLKKYYALSKLNHPDNFTLADSDAQHESEQKTSIINAAKLVLGNSYLRLEYILKERGIIAEDEKFALSPLFLSEMMEINEEMMELEFDKNIESIATIKEKSDVIENTIYKDVSHLFEQEELNMNSNEPELLKAYYYKKKYLLRIMERLNRML